MGKDIVGENGDAPYINPVPGGFMFPSASNIIAGFSNNNISIINMYSNNAIIHLDMIIMIQQMLLCLCYLIS